MVGVVSTSLAINKRPLHTRNEAQKNQVAMLSTAKFRSGSVPGSDKKPELLRDVTMFDKTGATIHEKKKDPPVMELTAQIATATHRRSVS